MKVTLDLTDLVATGQLTQNEADRLRGSGRKIRLRSAATSCWRSAPSL